MRRKVIRVMGVTITSVVATAFMSCSNDLFTEFDLEMNSDCLTSSLQNVVPCQNSIFLDWSANPKEGEYSPEDYEIIGLALSRIAIGKKEGKFIINKAVAKELSMTEELRTVAINMLMYTNKLVGESKQKQRITRTKSNSPELQSVYGDCVPVALTHVGAGTVPTLEQAYSYCDQYASNWRNVGVKMSNLYEILDKRVHKVRLIGAPITAPSYSQMYNCIMALDLGSGHAVNASYYTSNSYNSWIFFYDFWQGMNVGVVDATDSSTILGLYVWSSN